VRVQICRARAFNIPTTVTVSPEPAWSLKSGLINGQGTFFLSILSNAKILLMLSAFIKTLTHVPAKPRRR
jgi:hypothetical protein